MSPAFRNALVTVPLVVGLGILSGAVAGSAEENAWFAALAKPALYPPGAVFGIAWTILYALMGIALARVIAAGRSPARGTAVLLFVLQLALNLAWSSVFFRYHLLGASFLLILAILAAASLTTFAFARIDRAAGWLLVPYLAWLTFAAGLSLRIWQLNPAALATIST